MESARAFKESGALFKKAKLSLQRILPSLTAEDERKMVNRLIGAAAIRKEYVLASVRLEEAKLFERTGDYSASFQKYGGASEILEKVSSRVEAEEDRLEVQAMIAIIKGYELMTRAETESSPDLYIRAAESFEKAIETSPDGNWSLVLRGHSHFCRALSAGAKLVDSPNDALHQTAIEELDHARSCYLRARSLAAADCAEASRLLLEAYVLINKAKKGENPQEKSKVYHMVEKLLRVSADRYRRASQPTRRTKVLELLSSVRKERKIYGSLLFDVSRSPSILKSIAPLQAFETHHELSAGVRNFEDANIYANVKLNVSNPQVDQDIEAQVDIANAGRETASLVKMEIVIPDSFEVLEGAGSPKLEGKSFDLGNRKLHALKTETLRLLLKPKAEGLFVLKTRTYYVDSTSSTKVHDSDYTSIIVSPIAELLARAFAKDFKLERLPFEDSGWRTMMNIAASLKLPRSQVYGDLKSGHSFARPLEKLLNAGVIEYRRFPKQRGRGGTVTKLRLCYETDAAKSAVEKLSAGISPMR